MRPPRRRACALPGGGCAPSSTSGHSTSVSSSCSFLSSSDSKKESQQDPSPKSDRSLLHSLRGILRWARAFLTGVRAPSSSPSCTQRDVAMVRSETDGAWASGQAVGHSRGAPGTHTASMAPWEQPPLGRRTRTYGMGQWQASPDVPDGGRG